MRVHCAVTHVDEITLDYCLSRIQMQSLQPSNVTVVSGISPASEAFNRALEAAIQDDADALIHLAADVALDKKAFEDLLRHYDPQKHYAVVARGFDIFNGENAPIGLWAINMKAVGDQRFHDTYKMDLDFCARVEAASGLKRIKTKKGAVLGCHHPIWTPEELFKKFRYNAAKYGGKDINKYTRVFGRALEANPNNKALLAGQIGLKRGISEPALNRAPNRGLFSDEWADVSDLLDIKGGEFFAYHADFVELGRQLLGSTEPIVPMSGPFFARFEQNVLKANVKSVQERTVAVFSQKLKTLARPIFDKSPLMIQEITRRVLSKPAIRPETRISIAKKEPLLEFGSKLPGQAKWAEKWSQVRAENRVLMVAPKDFAGSMFKWAEAVNRYTDYAARLVTFEEHQYNYPLDLVVPECNDKRLDAFLRLADEAAVLHLKDEHSWFMALPQFKNIRLLNRLFWSEEFLSKPKVFTHYGGYARKFKESSEYIERVQRFDLRIAMTPDLNYDWFRGEYIPHTIDTDKYEFEWTDSDIFAHSPSTREKKGTHLLEEAVLVLEAKYSELWRNWTLDLIHGVSFDECIRRKRMASLFFDQAGRHRAAALGIEDLVGWYGNSAIEAMAFGIPTIAHLAEHAFEGAERAGVSIRDTPIINIQPTRESLLGAFLRFASAAPEHRMQLAKETRRYAVNFHGYEAVAARLASSYDKLTVREKLGRNDAGYKIRTSLTI